VALELRLLYLVKIPPPPPALLPSPVLNHPLILARFEEALLHSIGIAVHLTVLLLLEYHRETLLDPMLRTRETLLVVVCLLDNLTLRRLLLEVRMRPYPSPCLPTTSTDPDPPPVKTGTSTPAYSVFSENDLSNRSTMLHYISITAAPAYKGTSLEVGQPNFIYYFHPVRSC